MTLYLTAAEAAEIHRAMIEAHGGSHGIRDIGALEAALFRPQSGYYEDIVEEACALLESLAVNHPFIDGNKRVAFGAMEVFLLINGWRIDATPQQIYRLMRRLFDANRFELAELDKWFRPRIVRQANAKAAE
ncbi:MAG: death-on-curing family protein [Betaproteobacteria bacterium RIFCSPLOWO2_02_FULL_62_17]|nr:MAG: death-on-curing family protein [Betaproteobacteria bacterium RIFCSPLOWO2_02_FULL_62_17]